jgi:Na+-driven multidrug efflux pump
MPYAVEYLLPITLLGIPITMINQVPGDALRAEGKAMFMMATHDPVCRTQYYS